MYTQPNYEQANSKLWPNNKLLPNCEKLLSSCRQGVTCGELFSCSVQKLNFHGPHKMTTLSCFCTEELFPLYLYYMCDCIHGLRPENLVLVWKPSGFCFPRGLISRLRGTLWSSVKVHCYVRIPWNSQKQGSSKFKGKKLLLVLLFLHQPPGF